MGAEWNVHLGSDADIRSGSLRQLGSRAQSVRWSIARMEATTDVAAALTTQVMTSVGVVLRAGDLVTNIAVQFGATAASVPTNWWFALYSSAATPALLGQTADQLTGAIAANAVMDLALTTPYQVTTDGFYYVGIMVKATTVPSIICKVLPTAATGGATLTGVPVLAQTSGSALTTMAPSTIATPTTVVNVPLVVVH